MLTTPKAIFFDLDETLIANTIPIDKLFAKSFDAVSERIGEHNRTAFFTAFRQSASIIWNNMFEQKRTPEEQFLACFNSSLRSLGELSTTETKSISEQMYRNHLTLSCANIRFQPGAVETLQTLREQGFTTGIITNGIEQLQMAKIQALGLQSKVDSVVVSAQARAHKPNARVFELALAKTDVAATQAWHIGDHAINDVAGGIRAGLAGIFYDPTGKRADTAFADLEESPSHIINRLSDVIELLNR